jgi:hypothetical protein
MGYTYFTFNVLTYAQIVTAFRTGTMNRKDRCKPPCMFMHVIHTKYIIHILFAFFLSLTDNAGSGFWMDVQFII